MKRGDSQTSSRGKSGGGAKSFLGKKDKEKLLLVFTILMSLFIINFTSCFLFRLNFLEFSETNITFEGNFSHLEISDLNIVGYWPFDNDGSDEGIVYDYSSHNYDGILNGEIKWNSTGGKEGGAYEFNGVDQYIKINNLNSTSFLNNSFTFSLWQKTKNENGISFCLYDNSGQSSIYIYNTWVRGFDKKGTQFTQDVLGSKIINGTWTHIVVSFNYSSKLLSSYIDGTFYTVQNLSLDNITSFSFDSLNFGTDSDGNFDFNGSIDEAMIFNVVLNSTQIQKIYNYTYKRFKPRGLVTFNQNNFSTNFSFLNITFDFCNEVNSSKFGAKIGEGDQKIFSNCRLNNYNISGLENLENSNLSIILFSDSENYFSPIFKTPISVNDFLGDEVSPTFSNIEINNSIAGEEVKFSIFIDDDISLHPNGQYIFSTNNSGVWVNDVPINFTSTMEHINVIKTINSSGGKLIGYKWYIKDNNGNLNVTKVETFKSKNSSLFAFFLNLTWPPENYSDFNYGASSNPTSNLIGGFENYNRRIFPNMADYFVNTKEEFLVSLFNASYGQIIYINDSVTLDFTFEDPIEITQKKIIIASGRGMEGSQGAIIKKDIKNYSSGEGEQYLFKIYSPLVRFTGLRIYGGDVGTNMEYHYSIFKSGREDLIGKYYEIKPVASGIFSSAPNLEIDNSELYGWRDAAIGSSNGAINNYVHHNYIHHNLHNGLGYGVNLGVSNNISFLIEANIFESNKHSIAATYYNNSYEARYNIEKGLTYQHYFDRHGSPGYPENLTYGGKYTIIHHNDFYSFPLSSPEAFESEPFIHIRSPPIIKEGGQIYNNWFDCKNITKALRVLNASRLGSYPNYSKSNVSVFNNLLNFSGISHYFFPVIVLKSNKNNSSIDEQIIFDASSSYSLENNISYVEWDFSDGTPLMYGDKINHSFSESGRYKIKVTVYDNKGVFNSEYKEIIVFPNDDSKIYIDFWILENSEVLNTSILNKKLIVNNVTVWQENFSQGFVGERHIHVPVFQNLTNNKKLNVTFGVVVINNYTGPLYPEVHEVEFFEVGLDAFSIFYEGLEWVGSQGDFESIGNWNKLIVGTTDWSQNISWERKINGLNSYLISPRYRNNYTAGNFAGIKRTFTLNNTCVSTTPTTTPKTPTTSGGSISTTYTETQLAKGIKGHYPKNYVIKFKGDFVRVKNISGEGVELNVSNEIIEIVFDESVKVDSDEDGFYDLEISLGGANSVYAELSIKSIYEEMPAVRKEAKVEGEIGEEVEEDIEEKSNLIYWVVGGIVILVLGFIGWKFLKKGKK